MYPIEIIRLYSISWIEVADILKSYEGLVYATIRSKGVAFLRSYRITIEER